MPTLTALLAGELRITNPAVNSRIGNVPNLSDTPRIIQLLASNLIGLAFGLGGIIFFFMLIRGGYAYITAGGDKDAVQKAMKTLTTAFIGISILFSIFAVILIVETLFGINLRNLNIPTIN